MPMDVVDYGIFGDGSAQQGGLCGKLLGAGKRLVTGESLFTTIFHVPRNLRAYSPMKCSMSSSGTASRPSSRKPACVDYGPHSRATSAARWLEQTALELGALRCSRDAEREADAKGFETLARHGIDPSGMLDFFRTMAKEAGASPPAWLATHPASEARQQSLRNMLDALGSRPFPPLATAP